LREQELSLAQKRYRLLVFVAGEGHPAEEVIAVRLQRGEGDGAFELLTRAIEVGLLQQTFARLDKA